MSKKIETFCSVCSKFIGLKYKSAIKENQKFYCSKEHRRVLFKTIIQPRVKVKKDVKGENNPNYGKKWTEEQKKAQSDLMKSKVNDEYRFKAGSANRGKKFTKERCENISKGHIGINPWVNRIDPEKSKLKIGQKSSEKFTDEYNSKFRKKMEDENRWIPLDKKTDYEIYFKESEWNHSHIDIFMLDERFNEIGIFNNKNNSKGLVRDHLFSRKQGFQEKIFPILLRHPANVNIITHAENVSKRMKKQDILIDRETLFDMIISYDKVWFEQELCLEAIDMYRVGHRWERRV